MTDDAPRRTPLNALHRSLGARMVPFAGWDMPVQYSGILEESRAVRSDVGLFDISHMGRVILSGNGALALLQRLTSNDVSALGPGQAHYSLLTNPNGGIIDDIILYRLAEREFLVVINAGNAAKDLDWICDHAVPDVTIDDRTDATAMIAVQGPNAPQLVARLSSAEMLAVPRFAYRDATLAGVPAVLCRTGYTGEDGFEVIVRADRAEAVWRALQGGGGVPAGLGARDALRIEVGYPLYGHEIDESTTPVESGLMWVVKLAKGQFIGSEAIAARRSRGSPRRLVGLLVDGRIPPRQGYSIVAGEEPVGTVTSGVYSPTLSRGIGMAYVDDPHNKPGTELYMEVRGKRCPIAIVAKKDLL